MPDASTPQPEYGSPEAAAASQPPTRPGPHKQLPKSHRSLMSFASAHSALSAFSWASIGGSFSAASLLSATSFASVGSLASAFSVGSVLSVGSVGSVLSIGSVGGAGEVYGLPVAEWVARSI
ncbi:hypothetical protein LWF15_20055 [Kineosporia rhizophila]|uniref:hypothetical protein n=1 Tax=Kineosporia TaxID=49184 RepID=UPI001E426F4E|nr:MULTISPECIES: hypothetical protein [Kineosporia]MCE0537791.1 hypothetical protein [Kineosporia rhizophila]